MTRWRGGGAELAQVHDRWMLAYARLYQSYQLMDLVCDDHSEHFAALLRDYDGVKGERDEARAEVARLRARLAQVEAAGLLGMSIGQKDRNGRPVHYGDVLTFDEREWGEPGYTFEARLEDGAIPHYGDMPSWCEVIQAAPRPPAGPSPERALALMRHGPKRGGRG